MKKSSIGKKKNDLKKTELNDLFAELRGEYLDSFSEKTEIIRGFWQSSNREGLLNEFHKIKGTGTTYGLPEVSEVAELLEKMCERNSDKLGLSILMALELLQSIAHNYKAQLNYELHKDPLYKRLKIMSTKMELAS